MTSLNPLDARVDPGRLLYPGEPVTSSSLIACAGLDIPFSWARTEDSSLQILTVQWQSEGVTTKSYFFTSPEPVPGDSLSKETSIKPAPRINRNKARVTTPPAADPPAVPLQDRLLAVLEPPLANIVGEHEFDFPNTPFPYQLLGVAFLYMRDAAILADEMGLGKTMQAITATRVLLRRGEAQRILLICPKPLVANWRREYRTWAPEVCTLIVEGDRTRRQWQWQRREFPVTIANYELLQRDRELLTNGRPYDLVILDESQRIKNQGSSTSQIVRSIPRRRSWALTGTPVENSVEDLVGIFEFLSPGHIHGEMNPKRIGERTKEFVLRRKKEDVLKELPPKFFRDVELELTAEQRASYELAEKQGILRLTELGQGATIQHVFELVLRLKQICNFDPATGESAKLERIQADLEEVAASGRKAIIFSQWVETLESLARHLPRFHPLLFHGRIAHAKREGILSEFRENRRRQLLLLSYGAGGVGLNLQFAGYVFLFDRWWNPAVEDQAINRAHRIGAKFPVVVSRFLTLDTIEERIEQILCNKRELFQKIFADGENSHVPLSQQEMFGLFGIRQAGSSASAA